MIEHERRFSEKVSKILAFVLGMVTIVSLSYSLLSLQKKESVSLVNFEVHDVPDEQGVVFMPQVGLKSLSEYQELLGSRDIFSSADQMPLTPNVTTNYDGSLPTLEGVNNFKLVGIMFDKNPQVIIQDLQSNQSFFAHKGESVKGAIVQDIKSDRVVLQMNGQTFELIKK